MFYYRYCNLRTLVLILFHVIAIQKPTQQLALDTNYVNEFQQNLSHNEASSTYQDAIPKFQSPFIVLMSSESISVAQLPMILYGNISEIYHLLPNEELDLKADGEFEQNGQRHNDDNSDDQHEDARFVEETNEDGDEVRRRSKQPHDADAREYEQMPHNRQTSTVNMTTMSLGKSEWQQIAAGERDREEVWPSQVTPATNMNRKESQEDDDGKNERQLVVGRPRRRRRRSTSDGNSFNVDSSDSNNGGANRETYASASEAQTVRRVNRALESNVAMQNVTSAQSTSEEHQQQQQRQLNLALERTRSSGANAPAEDESGDKTSQHSGQLPSAHSPLPGRRVIFSDFDVHMALGYAFVADSAGRIHRFRLLSSSSNNNNGATKPASWSSSSLANDNDQHGWRIVPNSENSSEIDDTNAIDADASAGLARQSKESGISDFYRQQHVNSSYEALNSNSVQTTGNHTNDHGRLRHNEHSNDVNRVSGDDDVTHEQTGNERQHPAASGGANSAQASGPPISVGLRVSEQQLADSRRQNLERNGAKPRVIWSRNKNSGLSSLTHPKAATKSKQDYERTEQQLANVEGASTARESNQMVDERAPTMNKAATPTTRAKISADAPNNNGQPLLTTDDGNGRQRTSGCLSLRTEIAVDWLNDLLFVLDKCRLLVMDFQGANEVLLIDDFTPSNRPVDIKVDPMNDFLFWLQKGKFHNTIYKLDLSVLSMPNARQKVVGNTLRLRHSLDASNSEGGARFDATDLIPLVSHHYAHPIITNLPRHTQIFTIDHKHSRIYVPLVPPSANTDFAGNNSEQSTKHADEAEIFAPTNDVTHLNNTDLDSTLSDGGKNCATQVDLLLGEGGQILAYNLDGTDVGPLRTGAERSHIKNLDNMQDMTLDSKNNLLYWLTNDGKDLFEELRENLIIQPTQHNLGGKSYSKLIYFENSGFNQPMTFKSRSNVRESMHLLYTSILSNRTIRSDGIDQNYVDNLAVSLKVRHFEGEATRFSRNAPYIILGVTCLIVITVYLVYALIFQQSSMTSEERESRCRSGSISAGSSSIGDSQVESNMNGFLNTNTISRWIAGPSVRSADASTFNRDVSSGNGGPYDIESTNYEASNAIDEHYRDSIATANQLYDLSSSRLANLNEWPTNMHDRSNKLYVPVEVLQDDALSSIRRVSIDQLEIDRTAPLGEGHFGTVLQGKIKCTLHERTYLLDKSQLNTPLTGPISPDSLAPPASARTFGISSASSGHGSSSSTSCEFTTANSCTENTNDEDYLTPKNQSNSNSSDYCGEMPHCSTLRDDSCIEYCGPSQSTDDTSMVATKLMVAIKKLKDNASPEEKRDFLQEAKLLANFDHPNIVHLIGICLDRGSTLIVMELMLGGDLIRYMQENTPTSLNNYADNLTYDDLLKVCLDIANGCCYLEDMDYIHRDLAARNCLVSSRKREDRVVKLADFGLARDIYKDSYYKKLNDSAMPLKWMAPECLIEQKFTKKSDVWSFGVVMWEVMSYCQVKPYCGIEAFFMKEHLASGARLRKPDNCDDNMYRLMNQCWQMEPAKRPTFHECRAMLIEIRNGTKV